MHSVISQRSVLVLAPFACAPETIPLQQLLLPHSVAPVRRYIRDVQLLARVYRSQGAILSPSIAPWKAHHQVRFAAVIEHGAKQVHSSA